MTNLDKIKAEAVKKIVDLMTASVKENERRDCPYCDFKPGEFRPGKSLVMHMASMHRDKYKTKIEQVSDLLLSEIDRAVDCIIGEVEEMKNYAPPYPVREGVTDGRNEAMQDGARRGYFDALNDLLQKLSTLKEK